MDYQTLRLQIEGPIARLTLAKPDDANRINDRRLREIAAACEAIRDAAGVVVTLVDAEGADFCAGWSPETRDRLATSRRADPALLDPFGPLAELPGPVLVALQGEVRSAGLELALACDIRIASFDARFSLPEVGMGGLPLAGGSQRLPRIVGRSRAAAMLLLGEELDAESALRSGLVSKVVPAEQLEAAALELAGRVAIRGPVALRYAKEAVHKGIEMSLAPALRYELDLSVILQTTSDRAEGVQAFLEKREPHFDGQ